MAGSRRLTLRSRLERDVYAVLPQLEASNGGDPFRSIGSVYDAIQRSNSSLKRQKKRPLEDAIDRVLLFRKQEEDESVDSEAAIDDLDETPNQVVDERFLLNRQMVKLWKDDPPSSPGTLNEESPFKRRRIENLNSTSHTEEHHPTSLDAEDRRSRSSRSNKGVGEAALIEGSGADAMSAVNGRKQRSQSKIQKGPRAQAQYINEDEPLMGLGDVGDKIMLYAHKMLKSAEAFDAAHWNRSTGMIIAGPSGMGKKRLVKNIACQNGVPLVSLEDCFLEDSDRMEKYVTEAFDVAISSAPSIIFIENIEQYMSKRDAPQHENYHSKSIKVFKRQMARLQPEDGQVPFVLPIATTANILEIDPQVRDYGCLSRIYEMQIPDYQTRLSILRMLTKDIPLAVNVDLCDIARSTQCFVPKDLAYFLESVTAEAAKFSEGDDTEITESEMLRAVRQRDNETFRPYRPGGRFASFLSMEHFSQVLKGFTPSLRGEGFTVIPDVTWDQVGALHSVRKQLHKSIIGPIQQPDRYAEAGLRADAGVLLWGPPGCGKTLLAQAVANEAHASFILINGPEVLNKYVGESERAIRELFQRARSAKPCILFFDEFDSLVPPRTNAATESGARLVNALLTELDGAGDRDGICIIGTTNRPELIDEAILRPGRVGTHIFIDLPTSTERVDILRAVYRTRFKKCSPAAVDALAGIALDERCSGFSGADLSALAKAAGFAALERCSGMTSVEQPSSADWEIALNQTCPSVKDPASYRRFHQQNSI